MATLHPPTVDSPAAVATSTADPSENAPSEHWQHSDQAAPAGPEPTSSSKGEDEQLYGNDNPEISNETEDRKLHDENTLVQPSESTPDPSAIAAATLYQQSGLAGQQQFAHHQQYSGQPQTAQPAPDPQLGNPGQLGGPGGTGAGGGVGGGGGGAGGPAGGSKIFVGGLSWETDEDSLRSYFEQIGPVLDCVIMRDRHTGHPRGFGFVTFADDDAAGTAASRRHDLDGRQVEAKRAVPRNEGGGGGGAMTQGGVQSGAGSVFGSGPRGSAQSHPGPRFGGDVGGGGQAMHGGSGHRAHHTTKCKVFVGGLPSSCGVDDFRSYFSQFGDVVDAQVMIDHNTGNSRGFGFVTFGSEAIVNHVVGPGKSNTNHEIMGKCVEVKRAEPKGASNDRRNPRDNYGSGAGRGMGGGPPANDSSTAGGGGTNGAAAAAAAAYYNNYPASLAEQYGAYFNSPQWQQYYAALGYNVQAYPQGFNPYQQYLQAYMNTAANASGAGSGGTAMAASGSVEGGANASGAGGGGSGYENSQGGTGRYGAGGGTGGGDIGQSAPPNGHGSVANAGAGSGARRPSRRDDRYHPYR